MSSTPSILDEGLLSEIINTICTLLSLPEDSYNKYWEIIDATNLHENILVNVHHKLENLHSLKLENYSEDEKQIIKDLRGCIIDISDKKIVVPSSGFISKVEVNDIEYGEILYDQIRERVAIDESYNFYEHFDGTIIRITKYMNNLIFSTRKKINGKNSFWVVTDTFGELFTNLFYTKEQRERGKSFETLKEDIFPTAPPSLPINEEELSESVGYTHYFLISHPQLMIVSQKDIGEGKLIYLHTVLNTSTFQRCPDWENQSFNQYPITLEKANLLLSQGEEVIVSKESTIIRFQPSICLKRNKIRNNQPNLLLGFFELLNDKDQVEEKILEDFIDAVPLHKKIEVSKYLEIYRNGKDSIKSYLITNFTSINEKIKSKTLNSETRFKKLKGLNLAGKAIERLITQTVKYTTSASGNKVPLEKRIEKSINTLVDNEKGNSLYAMYIAIAEVKSA